MISLFADGTGPLALPSSEQPELPICKTADGKPVLNRLSTTLSDQQLALIIEAAWQVQTSGHFFVTTQVRFPTTIGYCAVVETTERDLTFWRCRPGQTDESRMIDKREPLTSNVLTVVLRKMARQSEAYNVVKAYIGERMEVEFHEIQRLRKQDGVTQITKSYRKKVKRQCSVYWRTHAFICEYPFQGGG